jgi:hypothetical protein
VEEKASFISVYYKSKTSLDAFGFDNGGQGEIRTRDRLTPISVFETDAFNRSATCPLGKG